MFKLKKIGVSMVLASLMLLAMVVPAFAVENVNIDIYKDGTYSPGIHSMANKSVKSAFIDEQDGVRMLFVNTQYFRFLGADGTLKQMKYLNDEGDIVESTINTAVPVEEGQIAIPLIDSAYNTLQNEGKVELRDAEVMSDVIFGLIHPEGKYKPVDFVISLQ